MQEDEILKTEKEKEMRERLERTTNDIFSFTHQMHQLSSTMDTLLETLKHKGKKSMSSEFNTTLVKILMQPNHPDSKEFLNKFIAMLKEPTYEPGDCQGDIVLVKPQTFAFNLQLLSQASRLAPILQELDLIHELDSLVENILTHFLPYIENKMATVEVSKKSNQKKGTELKLFRYNTHKIAALFLSAQIFSLIKKKSIQAAEESLNTAFKLRTQAQSTPSINQEDFAKLLSARKKILKKDLNSHRSDWNEGARVIKDLNKEILDNAGDCVHYLFCGEIAALQESPNFSLVECYCDLSEAALKKIRLNDKSISETIPFTGTAALLHKIADMHQQAGRMNSALRCYQKALNLYNQAKQSYLDNKFQILRENFTEEYFNKQLKKLYAPIVIISQSLRAIQQNAFEQFQSDWNRLKMPDEIESIEFEKSGYAMKVNFKDRALLLAWLKQLTQLHLRSEILTSPQKRLSVTLPNVHQLSAKQLFNSLERAQKVRQSEKIRAQKLLDIAAKKEKQKAEALVNTQKPLEDKQSNGYESSADKDLYPEPKTTKPKKLTGATQKIVSKKPVITVNSQTVCWKESLPDYVAEDHVYPIPDPFIANSCIPKGIFYGYIDDQLVSVNEEIDDDLLNKFREVLNTGMIAGLGDAQGIRPVQGELGHESDYLFKLNIGGQDFRLYGRKVAEQKLPNGQMVVLISFDQAIAHDQKLKLEPNDNNSKNTL